MLEAWRHRALVWWSGLLSRRPAAVLLIALALAGASIALAVAHWRFQSDRNALIDEDIDWNQRFIDWTRKFPGTGDLTVVIDTGQNADESRRAAARALADELGARLEQDRTIEHVVWRFHVSRSSPRAIRILGFDEFRARLADLEQAGPIVRSPTIGHLLAQTITQMMSMRDRDDDDTSVDSAAGGIDQLAALIGAIGTALADPSPDAGPFERLSIDGGSETDAWEYMTSDNKRLLFMRITPRHEEGALTAIGQAIESIRAALVEVVARYPGLEAGLTGIDVIETDETAAVTRDSTIASILALTLIALLMWTAFHSIRTPLLALAALLVGIAWAFGFLFLTIGHLQVLSVFFTVILLGLGIAYGIHLITRFELVRHQYSDDQAGFARTLEDTFSTMGPGILTGAVTTAAAFATTLLTDFRGVAEMGQIASVGIMLCLVAMFSAFPALLRLFKWRHGQVVPMKDRLVHLFEERWVSPFVRHPVLTLVTAGLLTAASLLAVSRMRFDYNLESLLPTGVESVTWQRRIVETGQSIYSGVSIVDNLDQARQRTEAFRRQPTIEEVHGIGLLFPRDDDRKIALLNEARARLGEPEDTPAPGSPAPDLADQLTRLRNLTRLFAAAIPEELKPAVTRVTAAADAALQTLNDLSPDDRAARLAQLQQRYDWWRRWVLTAFDTSPLTTEDLPAEILRSYRSVDGRLALEVHPSVPTAQKITSPLDPRFLPRFYRDMAAVDPEVTGVVVQYYLSGKLIRDSYIRAGLYALLIVFVLVYLDFRRLDDAVLALVPVAAGFAVTFGVMYLAGMKVNPANIIVLPLMFGIGVDAGVHIIHRYRQDPRTRPLGLTAGTGKGITLTSFTTMIGFGAMMIAHHRGIFSLGFVLTVGIGMTLLACWTIMPAWLELRTRRAATAAPQKNP